MGLFGEMPHGQVQLLTVRGPVSAFLLPSFVRCTSPLRYAQPSPLSHLSEAKSLSCEEKGEWYTARHLQPICEIRSKLPILRPHDLLIGCVECRIWPYFSVLNSNKSTCCTCNPLHLYFRTRNAKMRGHTGVCSL